MTGSEDPEDTASRKRANEDRSREGAGSSSTPGDDLAPDPAPASAGLSRSAARFLAQSHITQSSVQLSVQCAV